MICYIKNDLLVDVIRKVDNRKILKTQQTDTMIEILKTTGETREMLKLFIESSDKDIKNEASKKKLKVVKIIGKLEENQSVMLIYRV